jgi:hypothetical protein
MEATVTTILWAKEQVSTPHLQGLIQMTSPMSLATLKRKVPALQRAHLETMNGKFWQAAIYCLKDYLPQMMPYPTTYEDILSTLGSTKGKSTQQCTILRDFLETTPVSLLNSENTFVWNADAQYQESNIAEWLKIPKKKTTAKQK